MFEQLEIVDKVVKGRHMHDNLPLDSEPQTLCWTETESEVTGMYRVERVFDLVYAILYFKRH